MTPPPLNETPGNFRSTIPVGNHLWTIFVSHINSGSSICYLARMNVRHNKKILCRLGCHSEITFIFGSSIFFFCGYYYRITSPFTLRQDYAQLREGPGNTSNIEQWKLAWPRGGENKIPRMQTSTFFGHFVFSRQLNILLPARPVFHKYPFVWDSIDHVLHSGMFPNWNWFLAQTLLEG